MEGSLSLAKKKNKDLDNEKASLKIDLNANIDLNIISFAYCLAAKVASLSSLRAREPRCNW